MTIHAQKDNMIKPRILYVHYGENWLRGSEIVLLDLLRSVLEGQYTPVLWCNSEILANQAHNLGVEVIRDNFVCIAYWLKPKWNFIQFSKLLIKTKKLLKHYKISLVHCNNGAPCQWLMPICKLTGTPLLLHLHARYMYRDRLTLLFHGADSIIGVSKSVIDMFKHNEFLSQQVSVIYNGINPERVWSKKPKDIRAELSAKSTDFILLYIGSLIPRKLVHQLLYALNRLRVHYGVKLAIVGSGSEKKQLMNLATELELNDCVKFFSSCDNVASLYSSNVDCFVSAPAVEVFGLTLAEASIAKLPIITSNIPGINEIYTDKKNALLVCPNNVNELVEAIKSLIENPCLKDKIAVNAQRHILEAFSLEQQFSAFDSAYQKLLHQRINNNYQTILYYSKVILDALKHKLTKQLSCIVK